MTPPTFEIVTDAQASSLRVGTRAELEAWLTGQEYQPDLLRVAWKHPQHPTAYVMPSTTLAEIR